MGRIKSVRISEDCIGCALAHDTHPHLFDFVDMKNVVKEGVDFDTHADQIRSAAEICPMGTIIIEEE
jgi:ferredoxin